MPEIWAKIIAIYENIIQRGLPTWSSILVERALLKLVKGKLIKWNDGNIALDTNEASPIGARLLARAHFLADPRVDLTSCNVGARCDTKEERKFLTQRLPTTLGPELAQLVEPQRRLETMCVDEDFTDQRVDFALETGQIKIVIEIDGADHYEEPQESLDKLRDNALQRNGWRVIRIDNGKIDQDSALPELEPLRETLQKDPWCKYSRWNYQKPLWQTPDGLTALQLVLTPFAVARLQKALLLALENGALQPNAEQWNIIVVERDVPCARLAITDFLQNFRLLLKLAGSDTPVPPVHLYVFNTTEFTGCKDQVPEKLVKKLTITCERKEIGTEIGNIVPGDVLIDVSILQRHGFTTRLDGIGPQHVKVGGLMLEIRSTWAYQDIRRIKTQGPITYNITEDKKKTVQFFLRNMFRKTKFREGQFEVLQRTLGLKPVIALLPTGAGKSLCYQLSALLQPGVTLVVDPLKSLMVDQADNLNKSRIDNIQFINSDQTPEEKQYATQAMQKGKYQIMFISPERFQIIDFRLALTQLTSAFLVPYLIIDEAHCVSEWGHDFRTAYLNLVRTVHNNCVYRGIKPVVIALTGTASYSVLTDIQREIGVDEEEAKIQPRTFDRPELNYKIEKVPSAQKKEKLRELLLKKMPQFLETDDQSLFTVSGSSTNAGIIFVPHVNGDYGVFKICNWLRPLIQAEIQYFSGKPPRDWEEQEKDYNEYKRGTQEGFKNNKFPLLVSTNAFGMGIDKSNIRYTIHYNIPQSLEAFYQEAGRAGRDKQKSFCLMIFSDDSPQNADRFLDPNIDADNLSSMAQPVYSQMGDIHRMLFFHITAFRGVNWEVTTIMDLYNTKIKEKFVPLNEGEQAEISIPATDPNQVDEDDETIKLEKIIYRLTLIGLITDYTVNYKPNSITAIIVKRNEQEYISYLQRYVGRYKAEEYTRTIPELIQKEEGHDLIEKYVRFLVKFIYNEIEKKRRMAIRNITEVIRKCKTGEEFREELLAYLEKSPYSQPLNDLATRLETNDWWKILELAKEHKIEVDTPLILLAGCRRTLENFPEHPGLFLISAVARLMSANPDFNLIMSNVESGFRNILKLPELNERVPSIAGDFLKWVQELAKEGQRTVPDITELILKITPTRLVARAIYGYAPQKAMNVLLNLTLQNVRHFNQQFLEGMTVV